MFPFTLSYIMGLEATWATRDFEGVASGEVLTHSSWEGPTLLSGALTTKPSPRGTLRGQRFTELVMNTGGAEEEDQHCLQEGTDYPQGKLSYQ